MIKLKSHILVYWISFRGKNIWRCWIYKQALQIRRTSSQAVAAKSQGVEQGY
ncbi:hypothetical protein PCC7424_1991 [Gloeothece citriformis PCC 7424]|uniref:Uncharacterized protein n=1 Tax=Gloeothece citriformis (strain PCC 7424) TaxID=65393 RepID=B7KEW5_GLOC7|nr:hypothetical protein [Gloeothece citriformis]ACK70421.1 hypothetical protein PCC7424_1991 [Gloeothece citriformis PCC 7424]